MLKTIKQKSIMIAVALSLMLLALFVPSNAKVFASSVSDNLVVIFSESSKSGNNINIKVSLTQNTGVDSATFELVYNKSALTFTGYTKGSALGSLDLITTKTDTPQGYSITPFKFNWFNKSGSLHNDTSTGTLLTLHFTVKDTAKNGDYNVTFNYTRSKDITYFQDDNIYYKNAAIGGIKISIKDKAVEGTQKLEPVEASGLNPITIVLIVAGSVAIVCVGAVLIRNKVREKKRSKRWKKL